MKTAIDMTGINQQNMSSLRNFLEDRIHQLQARITSIEVFVENKGSFAGSSKGYTLKDIPPLKREIEETEAAIDGIKKWQQIPKKSHR